MIPLLKKLFFPAAYLVLVTGAHFAVLSLVSSNQWVKVFHANPQMLLLSALALAAVYISSFFVFFVLREKRELRWLLAYLLLGLGVAYFAYAVFFTGDGFLQKTGVSVVLLSWVAVALVLFQMEKTLLAQIMRYVLGITLLAISLASMYEHRELLFLSATLTADPSAGEKRFSKRESGINTDFYRLAATEYFTSNYYIPQKWSDIPSYLGVIDDKNFLVIDRVGNMFHLYLKEEASEEENLYLQKLAARFPINYQELYASVDKNKTLSKNINKYSFRVHDVYIEKSNESGKQRSLYVSHHFWDAEKECFTVRITKMAGDISVLLEPNATPTWRTLYESAPCFPKLFYGDQAGGRIVGMDEESLLFTIGDHGFDSMRKSENSPQNIDAAYGKIWKIDRTTGAADMVSLGHRNPQGLYRAPDATIWSTEHGPASGDELNRIDIGANYGWPYVLYGTSYGARTFRGRAIQNDHGDYEHPVFAWVPAVAVSELTGVEGDLFPLWKGNLLVSTLKKKTLFRMQMHEGRVVYAEAIKVGRRIRDLAQTSRGELLLWTDSRSLIWLRRYGPGFREAKQSLANEGEQVFQEKCAACHSLLPDLVHGIGPNLYKVYASKIASHADYSYSEALLAHFRNSWTRKQLDLFLKAPSHFAPGTIMQQIETSTGERQALIHYLENN